jgi:hypothetical protein
VARSHLREYCLIGRALELVEILVLFCEELFHAAGDCRRDSTG